MTILNDTPLVSVIMPAYNAETTIAESIQSVIDQTYQNWELIIVDDGSTDETSQIAESYKEKRIRLIKKANSGVADTRNLAIQWSSGSLVAFLDSDDLWMSDKLEKQVEFFISNNNIFGLVHTGYIEFDKIREFNPKPFKHVSKRDISGNVTSQLMIHDFVATLTVMVRKEVFDEVGLFDLNFNGTEDWDLWIRIAQKYRFGFIDLPLAKYRLNPIGLSKTINKFEKELWKVVNKHLLASDLDRSKKNKGLWLYFRHMAHSYAKSNNPEIAFSFLVKAIKCRPTNIYNIASMFYLLYLKFLICLQTKKLR